VARFGDLGRPRAFVVALAPAVVAAVVAVSTVADAQEGPQCRNKTATIVGTSGPDRLRGTAERDVIFAGAGGDIVDGLAGRDLICGGAGDDVLFGGTGSDPLFGGDGADLLHGNRGNDRVSGGSGDRDLAFGDFGDDFVRGGAGAFDEAAGGLGIDVVNGGPGDGDLVSGDYGYDVMVGGAGVGDVASFATEVPDRFGTGIEASLASGRASGDGTDVLRRFEDLKGSPFDDLLIGNPGANQIDGGPGDDRLRGGGGRDTALGDQGADRCSGFALTAACGPARAVTAPVFATVDISPAGGGDFVVLPAKGGGDRLRVSFDRDAGTFRLASRRPIAIGDGCSRAEGTLTVVSCEVIGPTRSFVANLGPGDDRLTVVGDLLGVGQVRVTGGAGNDTLVGGLEDDLFQAGAGEDELRGGGGSDGLIGGIPGRDRLVGGPGGDLISAGGPCIGGVLVGGAGRDNASFAETLGHPGVLYASLAAGTAKVDAIPGCRAVRLHPSLEDLEGSFDWDILIGDAGANGIHGQPGRDRLFGRGGADVISAEDGQPDFALSCGGGPDELFSDPVDPPGRHC
jgi:Ca2+-binding RTX toxin-like protein